MAKKLQRTFKSRADANRWVDHLENNLHYVVFMVDMQEWVSADDEDLVECFVGYYEF